MEIKLVRESENTLTVIFPSSINTDSFERVIKQAYKKSFAKKRIRIIFDFKYVYWFEIFYLSLFSLWLLELREKNKEIIIKPPADDRIKDFLANYHFVSFLKDNKIFFEGLSESKKGLSKNAPFFPLTQLSQTKYNEILNALSNEDFFSTLFAVYINKNNIYEKLIQKGHILDVIIKQLGDNIYHHTDGRYANIIMTKFTGSNSQNINAAPDYEKIFFNEIKNTPYLVIVISDKGKGIFETLSNSFFSEREVSSIPKKYESEIIEYATHEFTTSRPIEVRYGDDYSEIPEHLKDIDPFTGLFVVREIVKKYNGSLLIRSGKSFMYLNFYDFNTKGERKFLSNYSKKYQNLADFRGTQIKIVLPIENLEKFRFQPKFRTSDLKSKEGSEFIKLKDYLKIRIGINSLREIIILPELLIYLNDLESKNFTRLIIDFTDSSEIDSKRLYIVVCQLMRLQHSTSKPILILNLDTSLANILNGALEKQSNTIEAGIIIFNNFYFSDIIGISENDRSLFREIMQRGAIETDAHEDFAKKYNYLFIKTDEFGYELVISLNTVLQLIRKSRESEIKKIILNPDNLIFYQGIKVLSSANDQYYESYFEIFKFFQNSEWKLKLFEWLNSYIIQYKPKYIISVGSLCYDFIEEYKASGINNSNIGIENLLLATPASAVSIENIADKVVASSVLIFTDVIASGKTLDQLSKELTAEKNITILALVNCSTKQNFNNNVGKLIHLKDIVEYPLNSYSSKPEEWDYDDIYETDEETHELIDTSVSTNVEGPFSENLKPYGIYQLHRERNGKSFELLSNGFIDNVIIKYDSYLSRVIAYDRFMPIMFDFNRVVDAMSEEISSAIISDLEFAISEMNIINKNVFKKLYYLDYGQLYNFNRIIMNIFLNFLPEISSGKILMNNLESKSFNKTYRDKGVIILEDAFYNGENIFKLIDYCESRGAKYIFIYILIKRGNDRIADRLKKIKCYGNAEVRIRYLFDIEIPVYHILDNPIIKNVLDLEYIKGKFRTTELSDTLEILINRYQYQQLNNDAHISVYYNYRPKGNAKIVELRWLLEISKNRLAARKHLLFLIETEDDKTILTIFSILFEERYWFQEKNKDILNKVFYHKSILNNCLKRIAKDITKLSEEDILAVLYIYFNTFTEEAILVIEEIFLLHIKSDKILKMVIIFLELQKVDDKIITLKLNLLNAIESPWFNTTNDSKRYLYRHIERLWKLEKKDSIKGTNSEFVESIRILLRASFHNFKKEFNKKVNELNTLEDARKFWDFAVDTIQDAIDNFNRFIFSLKKNTLAKTFIGKCNLLITSIQEGKDFFLNLENRNVEYDREKEDLNKIFTKIYSLLFDNEVGLIVLLEKSFKVEIKKEIQSYLGNPEYQFDLTPHYFSVGVACVVLSDTFTIDSILNEIFSNLKIHSGATRIGVEIRKEATQNDSWVIVNIFDNGNNNKDLTKRVGIELAMQSMEKYFGDLTLKKLAKTEPLYIKGFRTYVTLKFHDLSDNIINDSKYATK
jgi:hypoxanthine-guanine phosphoribosyltransferase